MKQILPSIRNGLFGVAVAAALGFGAATAFASQGGPCSDPFASGSCRTQSDCEDLCASKGFDPGASLCKDRCCFCNAV